MTAAEVQPRQATGASRRPLTVIHSAPVWLPRTQTWMHSQARALPADIESHVVCESTDNLDAFPMPHIHSLQAGSRLYHWFDKVMRGCGLRRHLGHLPQVAAATGADVLHSHFGHIGWLDLAAARRVRAHVVTFYGQDVNHLPTVDRRWYARYRELFAAVDAVLCEGPHMARCIVEQLGAPRDKVRVHHLGVDLAALPFRPRVRRDGEPLKVLMAGSFTEKKGIPDGLAALGRLREEVDLQVTLIGDANAEPRNQAEKRRILAAIDDHGLAGRVALPGYQPHAELHRQAHLHHVFLSPSVHARDGDTEGGAPVTILELLATGMPVVSTRHCDIPAVVPEGAGLLAEEHDVEALAGHLRQLAAAPAQWAAMAEAGRRHVEAEYDLLRQGEALGAIYRELAR